MIWVVNRWVKKLQERFNHLLHDSGDNGILDDEGNACGIIAIPSIKSTFYNEHIYVLHYLPK